MADVFSKAKRSWVMSRIRGKDTGPERRVRSFLHRHGFRFRLHESSLPGKPDVVLPKHRTVVFVNGCFWHGHSCKDGRRPRSNRRYWNAKLERNVQRDVRTGKELRRLGWKRVVVWECQVKNTARLEARLVKLLRLGR